MRSKSMMVSEPMGERVSSKELPAWEALLTEAMCDSQICTAGELLADDFLHELVRFVVETRR